MTHLFCEVKDMKYRTIGYVANTHGIKGELKIKPQTHFINERFAKENKVYLEFDNRYLPLTIAYAREKHPMIIAKFKEYDDINQVEKWKGARLCIHEDQLTPLSDDEIYYHDLMQMHVYDPNQAFLGEVVELIETGAQLVLRIRGESEWLLPYTKAFVKDVDILQKRLIVEPIEGML